MSDTAKTHSGPSYFTVFYALMVLTVITVAVAYIPWNPIFGVVIAMAIASFKATLVGLYFMHLKFEVPSVYVLVIVPTILTAILVLALVPDVVGRFGG